MSKALIKSTIALLLFTVCAYVYVMWQQNTNLKIITKLNNIYEEIVVIRQAMEADCQTVKISAYHPRSMGINSDKNPDRTAVMTKPIPGYTCAISDDLFELGWLGKKIYIDGLGVWKASDRMGKCIKGKQIDICAPSLKYAKKFGIKNDIKAIILN